MRKIWMLLIMLAMLGGVVHAGQKIQTVKIKTRIACDHCNLCGSCGKRIENALYAQKGVKRVDVDDKNMEIVVVYNTEKTSPEALRTVISQNGYDADDLRATPESYAKLDGCCKGEAE